MITIIHGDDIATSRNYLQEIRRKNPEAFSLSGEAMTITDITQMMDGGDLFLTEKTIIIEHFYAKKRAVKEFEAIVAFLQEKTLEHEIIIWEGKELDKKSLALFKHAVVKHYKLPQTLFLFLDSLKPGQGKQLVSLFHKVLMTTEADMVFFMLVRQFRILLALSEKSTKQIDEVKRLAPWQIGKMQKQASLFPQEKLIDIYSRLITIDKGMKTGELASPLTVALDILLVDI